MASKYKNATEDDILLKLMNWAEDDHYPFHQPVLQRDTFWVYCNCRRYWGSYRSALQEVEVKADAVQNEMGYEIDWWPFQDGDSQKECLAIALHYLDGRGVSLVPKALKNSPYFDLYTDAVLLFGKFDAALEYANVTKKTSNLIRYPESKSICRKVLKMYCCDDHKKRCKCLRDLGLDDYEEEIDLRQNSLAECMAIVDGANVGYLNEKASLECVRLVVDYLQSHGFRRDNIVIIFDAAFRYQVDTVDFDNLLRRDTRYTRAPAGEQADAHVLTMAWEEKKRNPAFPPFIISSDQYKDYFARNPQLEDLKSRKKGVTWTFRLKKPEPVISFLNF